MRDKIPLGAAMNKGLTIQTGQTHVQAYIGPLLKRIEAGEIDPSFVVTHPASLIAAWSVAWLASNMATHLDPLAGPRVGSLACSSARTRAASSARRRH